MRVVVLVENTSYENYKGEHGLSLYIEHNGMKYLLDTGSSDLFAQNAMNMGIDLSLIDVAFLSHAHYDHSSGFEKFFEMNSQAKVYLQKTAKIKQYFKIVGPLKKYIGIPDGLLDRYESRFEYISGYEEIREGVYVLPHSTPELYKRGKRAHMYGIIEGNCVADDFAHEQTVIFEENNNLFCFNSCSHGGVDNIMEEIKNAFPNKKIMMFFGGFHMMGTLGTSTCAFSEKEVKAVAEKLLADGDTLFYSGHCTGEIAFEWMKETLGDRLIGIHSGFCVEYQE